MQANIAPALWHLLCAAQPGHGEQRIQLRLTDGRQRIVLINHHHQRIHRHRHRQRCITIARDKQLTLIHLHRPAHGAKLSGPCGQRGRRRRRSRRLHLHVDTRRLTAEIFAPQRHQVAQRVRAHAAQVAGQHALLSRRQQRAQ